MQQSMANLRKMSEELNCECLVLRERMEEGGSVTEALIRTRVTERDFMEIR